MILAYTVLFLFSAKTLFFLNCCDLILFCMFVHLFTGVLEPDDSDDTVEPTCEHRWICNEEALQLSLSSGRYPEYLGIEGPQDRNNPQTCIPLDFLILFMARVPL